MSDFIDRQEAIKLAYRIVEHMAASSLYWDELRMWARELFEKIPSAQLERKKGKWKIKTISTFDLAYGSTGYEPVYECSVCGAVEESYLRLDEPIMPEDADFPKYCPNCGARMDGGDNDQD